MNSAQCPRCQKRSESFPHIFQCRCAQNTSSHKSHLGTFRQILRREGTHLLVLNAMSDILQSFHIGRKLVYTAPLLGDCAKIQSVRQVTLQQVQLELDSLVRGKIIRNWSVAKPEDKDLKLIKIVLRALWTFSTNMWLDRCKQVHSTSKEDSDNLTHQDLLFSIRTYLRLPRHTLLIQEKRLHINITKCMRVAHSNTLVRWIKLL